MSEYLDLHALADGELHGEAKHQAEELLRTSPQANAEYQAIVALKQAVGTKATNTFEADTWKNAVSRLNEIDKKKRAETFVGKYAWAMCTVIFAAIVSAGLMNRSIGRSVGASDVAQMAASLAPFSRNMASQPQDMKSWIQDVSRGAPLKVESRDLRVLSYWQGAREDQYVTVFYCVDQIGPITLVIVKGANQVTGLEPIDGNGRYLAGQIDRANSLSWSNQGFVITLIGNRKYDELAQVADGIALR